MPDDRLLEELLNQRVAAGQPTPADPLRRAALLAVLAALVPAVALGLLGLLVGILVAVAVFAGVLVLIAGGLLTAVFRSGDSRVVAAIGGRPADPVSDARLLNLVEGLCTATGLRPPRVRVLEADGLNALAAGRNPSHAILAVTSGLLEQLSRIELEGVLAEEVLAIRRGRMVPATVAASVPPALARLVPAGPPPDLEADLAAVALTRYPPGLLGALEKMRERGTAVPTSPSIDALWMADPGRAVATDRAPARVPLAARIEALARL